jgi:16S rRNA (cytosine967-C5)-methyltransferase
VSDDRIDPARRAAYDALHRIARDDGYANLVVPEFVAHLDGRDAAFATELCYGTLRQRGWLDAVIAACVDRPIEKVDPRLRDILRLGAYQLLEMRVPQHAAVNSGVELARSVAGEGPARFVNAVLRRVSRQEAPAWRAKILPAATKDPDGRLAMEFSHPRWVVAALRASLGAAAEELPALLAADNAAPAVSLVVRPGSCEVSELLSAGALPGRWSPYAAVLTGGRPGDIPAVAERRAGVQDEGSQLVALALSRVEIAGADANWLDMCAGPGGKAALLTGLAHLRGAHLLAADVRAHRADLVARSLRGQAGLLGVVVADGGRPAWRPGMFDRILVDAPCTGLGALRRRPEARWRREAADVDRLQPVQRELLRSALSSVRLGGVVAYVTCSPHLGETDDVVAAVGAGRSDLEVLDARAYLPEVPDLGDGPAVRLWPHRHGTDAMFLALIRRTG